MGGGSDLGRLDAKGSAGPTRADGTRPSRNRADRDRAITATTVGQPAGDGVHAEFGVSADRVGDRVVLAVTGDLDLASAHLLTELGVPATQVPGCRTIELYLSAVTFLDARGLGALTALRGHATRHGRRLQISRRSRQVDRLLTLTGLDDHLHDAPDATEPS